MKKIILLAIFVAPSLVRPDYANYKDFKEYLLYKKLDSNWVNKHEEKWAAESLRKLIEHLKTDKPTSFFDLESCLKEINFDLSRIKFFFNAIKCSEACKEEFEPFVKDFEHWAKNQNDDLQGSLLERATCYKAILEERKRNRKLIKKYKKYEEAAEQSPERCIQLGSYSLCKKG